VASFEVRADWIRLIGRESRVGYAYLWCIRKMGFSFELLETTFILS
jgi:hypothetical protein